MRFLVLDDSRAMRMLIRSAVAAMGHEVTEAADGREGLERVKTQGPFAFALVDWNMPVMNGFEFVRAVRADHSHDAMKVVMITTEVETSQMAKALEAGANVYVMKPFTREGLQEKIGMLATAA